MGDVPDDPIDVWQDSKVREMMRKLAMYCSFELAPLSLDESYNSSVERENVSILYCAPLPMAYVCNELLQSSLLFLLIFFLCFTKYFP